MAIASSQETVPRYGREPPRVVKMRVVTDSARKKHDRPQEVNAGALTASERVNRRERGMPRSAYGVLPASLRGLLEELASADATADQRWILSLLQRHGPGVVQLLWRMLGREPDVLDAYQTVVCHLAARGPDRTGRDRPAYFYRAAMNTAIEIIRRRGREHDRLQKVASRSATGATRASHFSDTDHLRLVEHVRQAILQLPAHLRDVIVLRELAGMDYRQLSAVMNITSATARVYRRQAILRLAARLTKEEP